MPINFEDYLNPNISFSNIDRYYVRKSILEALIKNKNYLKGTLLDIGCGKMPYKKILLKPLGNVDTYIGLDLETPVNEGYAAIKPDLIWNGKDIPMIRDSVNSLLLTEVLEHCFEPQLLLNESYKVIKKNGFIFATVPFIWPLHDIPYDYYRYSPYSLNKLFENSGFINIKIEALGGWNASLGQMISLWLNRSGSISYKKRKFLYYIVLKKLIKWLYTTDKKPNNFYDNSVMVTGFTVLAQK